jgi:signal transduction histidine kinase
MFDRQDQTRISTAVSEITRNAFEYAGGGRIELAIDEAQGPSFVVAIKDNGPGIADLDLILMGQFQSKTGMGLGIIGAKRLMERFEIETKPNGGTVVTLGKKLTARAIPFTNLRLKEITAELARKGAESPFHEVQEQNQELLRALSELRTQQSELEQLNRELEETNRGVVALYAELDEKAESLRRASEAKTSFLSNMTHEFRTPLNSILSLSQAALSEKDAPLHPEHKKQITFIRKSAESLSELVNDLLDIAKVEAGRIDVHPSDFTVPELFGALRGVLRPLIAANSEVALIFEEPSESLALQTDEGKLAQILRNLVANALKYTEQGEIRVRADVQAGGLLCFSVTDTGIGIAAQDQDRIFEEFVQVQNPLQRKSKGTGLGLPLSRKLARLLGGELTVVSEINKGSTFSVVIPMKYASNPAQPDDGDHSTSWTPGLSTNPPATERKNLQRALIIDDEEVSRYLLKALIPSHLSIFEASDGFQGIRSASQNRPDVIFLDLQMPAMSGFYILEVLKGNPLTRDIPVIIHTAMTLTAAEKKELTALSVAIVSKNISSQQEAKNQIRQALILAGFDIDASESGVVYA